MSSDPDLSKNVTEEERSLNELAAVPPMIGGKVKINMKSDSNVASVYRSNTAVAPAPGSRGKFDFAGHGGSVVGVTNAPFLAKASTTTTQQHPSISIPISSVKSSIPFKEPELIDVFNQDMEECGMQPCTVFVPCAILEDLDEPLELLVPGLVREEKQAEEVEDEESKNLSYGLKINDSSCVVSNGIKESLQLIPLSLARVSNELDLKLVPQENVSSSESRNKHVPQIEGCVMIQRKPIDFAVHLYELPNDNSATVIEFQRRNGDAFAFQKFYDNCLEQLSKNMKDLRNCNHNSTANQWNCLPSLDGLLLDGFPAEASLWDKASLDLLADLIKDESQEAVTMLGNLCDEMETYQPLRREVSQHQLLMEQLTTRVLVHQDQCFVTLGLVTLYTSLFAEKTDLVKNVLRSYQTLAFVIGLLNSESMFVLRHAVRLLALLANKCECPWKLNESQKQTLKDRLFRVQRNLLEGQAWSSTYATEAFVTKEMFQDIIQHPKI